MAKPFPLSAPPEHLEILQDVLRLRALDMAALMDTPQEEIFDRAVRLATTVTGVKVGLLSLVDGDRQFFKASHGLAITSEADRQTPLCSSFCQYVVTTRDALAVTDAREHDLLKDNPAIRDLDVIAYLGVPVHDASGHALGSFCAIHDEPHEWTEQDVQSLTDLRNMVETELMLRAVLSERQILLDEMNHRLKNLFALVSGFIRMNRRNYTEVGPLADALEDRISALARAHELIVPVVTATRNFIPEVSLLALFETVLRPHVPIGSDRLVLDGPDVQLEAQRITNLALAIHELATNAAKYGALSGLEGTLHVRWSVQDGALSLQWHENLPFGSLQPSAHKGFGTRLVQMCIEGQLGGRVVSVADPSGMRYDISFPL